MSRIIRHGYVDKRDEVSVHTHDGTSVARYSLSGTLLVRHPGKLIVITSAQYAVDTWVEDTGEGGAHAGEGWRAQVKSLPLTVVIKTPDGQPFTADHVTLKDLSRFRDLRGVSQGTWTFTLSGATDPIAVEPQMTRVRSLKTHVLIALDEPLNSESAPPLVSDTVPAHGSRRFDFDLFRVGTFIASVRAQGHVGHRRLILSDPDGIPVASTDDSDLTFPVTLAALGKSRDAAGKARMWSLEVLPAPIPFGFGPVTVSATVVASARVDTRLVMSRLNNLLGPHGSFISIFGELVGSDMVARLKILDLITAETADMHGLLDSVLSEKVAIHKDEVYTLKKHSRDLGHELHVSLNDVRVGTIDVSIGASEHIQPPVPALKVDVAVSGHVTVKIGGSPFATVKIRGNRLSAEMGVRAASGAVSSEVWLKDNRLEIDVHWTTEVELALSTAGFGNVTAHGAAKILEEVLDPLLVDGLRDVIGSGMIKLPDILQTLLGGEFTYRDVRLEGEELVFDYVAPIESEPVANPEYVEIIGRAATQLGPHKWHLKPPSLGNTWSTDNLKNIDHIVVVIMENRSFDHVLGYRAQLPDVQGSDGLTPDLVSFLESKGHPIPKLGSDTSGIEKNFFEFRTKFPAKVGHGFDDVAQQLSETLALPSGRSINSPQGFKLNFEPRAKKAPEIKVDDVLGYYEAKDLPFFDFLATHYSYCERFFCSHPGPTLPNRMLSLSGDLQMDRTGEAIINNNDGDNFILSRAQTIFDVLTRKGISWRVYESPPSVTMLRMFARYAGDNTNILPLSRFADDVAPGKIVPSVMFVDPAMHHFPQNDDHPIADMYNGQVFLKGVYDALRANETLWHKTLLIITYDEHGGFYDHVIPPLAEARMRPIDATEGPLSPDEGAFTPSTLKTPYGVRVPTFVVSPWVLPGKGPDIVLDFCSILKTILARFCGSDKPFVSDRVNASLTFDSYLSAPEARMSVPSSPVIVPIPPESQLDAQKRFSTTAIDTDPMSKEKMRSGDVDSNELMGFLARILGR